MNTYEILESLRDNIGEKVEKHWSNKLLIRVINIEHRKLASKVLNSPGDWLLKKSSSLTPSSSIITLPSDCVRPAYMEEVSSGRPIPIRGTVRERRLERMAGTSLSTGNVEAYLVGNTVEVNQDSFSNAVYVWYQKRVVDLHAGLCSNDTDATHVGFQLSLWPSGEDDYYNGITIEVRDQDTDVLNVSTTITDFVGTTGVAEVGSVLVTPASGDFYGTVSQLPEELHDFILLASTVRVLAKPSSIFEKEIFLYWNNEMKKMEKDVDDFLATRFSGSSYVRIAERF